MDPLRRLLEPLIWLLAAIAAGVVIVRVYPHVFPFVPQHGPAGRGEIEAIALERLRELGPPVEDPYVVVHFDNSALLERRLQLEAEERGVATLADSWLAEALAIWEVRVYPRGAPPGEWAYAAHIDRTGRVLGLRLQMPETEVSPAPEEADARRQAEDYLARQGFDLVDFEPAPEVKREEVGDRVDLTLHYRHREQALGPEHGYGVAVSFAGSELTGFERWFEDADPDPIRREFGRIPLVFISAAALYFVITLLVAIPFLRRYHGGQLGVRRGLHFLILCIVLGVVAVALGARANSENANFGLASRQQTAWIFAAIIYLFNYLSLAVIALMSWSVGESLCRQRWAHKLAAVDALFRLRWANATVARSSLRGLAAGVVGVAAIVLTARALRDIGVWSLAAFNYGPSTASALPALAWFGNVFAVVVPLLLLALLLVPSALMLRFGPTRGALMAALPGAFLCLGVGMVTLPLVWTLLLSLISVLVGLALFRWGDLLSALLAGLVMALLPVLLPALLSGQPRLELNAWAALLVVASPAIVGLRFLGSDREFVYTYDDVPPHVRRIAERERQRVELETARGIQSSILPELPPQLAGVEIAHSYLPATEVGGDFYDVLALEDGRLAVAVGDVAGHGVSSGLVMSMAKSALAVQVTFDPAVESVMSTLNRMVYQSARARLLTTLCYALVDPARGELVYSSAGHLFPYKISPTGEVTALHAGAYPLGVRGQLQTIVRTEKLAPGDTVFLYSDGLVEACPEDGDEQFGFERLEASLAHHAGKPPLQLRDAVLAEVEAYTGGAASDDDLTVLVLRLPAA